nr:hypothetical protein CFP56_76493 [Quercus suber]
MSRHTSLRTGKSTSPTCLTTARRPRHRHCYRRHRRHWSRLHLRRCLMSRANLELRESHVLPRRLEGFYLVAQLCFFSIGPRESESKSESRGQDACELARIALASWLSKRMRPARRWLVTLEKGFSLLRVCSG